MKVLTKRVMALSIFLPKTSRGERKGYVRREGKGKGEGDKGKGDQ